MNTIKMKSVGELVRAAKKSPVERYKISSYQRGYRWKAEEQVRALLDDLKDFFQQPKGEIYCLQPIVVAKGQDGKSSTDSNDSPPYFCSCTCWEQKRSMTSILK